MMYLCKHIVDTCCLYVDVVTRSILEISTSQSALTIILFTSLTGFILWEGNKLTKPFHVIRKVV